MSSPSAGGRLTTHVLDTMAGRPAAGIGILLSTLDGDSAHALVETHTNAEGRTDAPLLAGESFAVGRYELVFRVAGYFRAQGAPVADPPFLDEVPIRFAIAEPGAHYHVPLLISPFGYSTYRGS